MIDRCDGRYPAPQTAPPRNEPFEVTYRCALPTGHSGPHGPEAATERAALKTEDEIARYYWPKDSQPSEEPAPWFRAAISDAFDSGIAFAVHRGAANSTQVPKDCAGSLPGSDSLVNARKPSND